MLPIYRMDLTRGSKHLIIVDYSAVTIFPGESPLIREIGKWHPRTMGAILSLHVNVNVPDFFKEGGGYT